MQDVEAVSDGSSAEISVIVATFNEQNTIEECVRRLFAQFPSDCEVLVVDGGNDETGSVVNSLCSEFRLLRYIRNEDDRGKGHATKVGIAESVGRYLVEIDADMQFVPEEIPRLLAPLQAGQADVALGSRFMRDSVCKPGSTTPLRTFGNYTTSLYASILFGRRMTDVLAGMTAWTRHAAQVAAIVSDNYSYEVELPVKALKRGLRVVDVPVTTLARQEGRSNVHVVTDGLTILRDITLFRLGLR
ncbi:MAG: glycosyltransferase family 2 protein [Planctomycetota bacterium]|nr:MAG: glycosyltransferase family 2 protein [Planctomycetota bacterium]REK30656.1 MAG: glycosyltransferase family 2 protein [Planctomycetota bacterium]REK33030.1 MAG: glycosyltransferase family 2 protein [Planctomycetota bacterium]